MSTNQILSKVWPFCNAFGKFRAKNISVIIFLLLISLNSSAQKTRNVVPTNSKTTNQRLAKHNDTVVNVTSDSFIIDRFRQGNSTIKLILQKQDEPSDGWFIKYVYPVILLLVGVMIPLLIEFFNDKKRIRKVGERWTAEIRFLETPIKSQIKEIENYLSVHNQDNLVFPGFQIIEGLDCKIFDSLDKSELLKFLEKNKTSDYEKAVGQSNFINGYIGIVKGSNTNLTLKFKEYSDSISNYITKVSENLNSISRAFGTYSVLLEQELQAEPIHDKRFTDIQTLFDLEIEPFRPTGNYDIYRLHDKFLMPLLFILGHLRHDFRTNEMAKYLANAIDAVKGIKMEKQYFKTNLETIISRYKENLEELPQVVRLVQQA